MCALHDLSAGKDVQRRSVADQLAARHDDDPWCVLGDEIHVMGDGDDSSSTGMEFVHQGHHGFTAAPVQTRCGLIHYEHLRLHRKY